MIDWSLALIVAVLQLVLVNKLTLIVAVLQLVLVNKLN
jgi:hypothetical protein